MSVAFYDVIVLGGGAAGLMCAIQAGRRGRSVVVLEHAPELGRKILISGGGRCNFTNVNTRPDNFLSRNPHFAKSALARYRPADFIALLQKHKVPYHEKTLGQLFCDRSARDVMGILTAECEAAGVSVKTNCMVCEVNRDTRFRVETSKGPLEASALVVATGGLSIPKMGATGRGYELARQFGLKIVPCHPALVPLTFTEPERSRFSALAGVSQPVTATVRKQMFRENMLFTHRGLSGPAILQISSYWTPGDDVLVDLLPAASMEEDLLRIKASLPALSLRSALSGLLPNRLAQTWPLPSQSRLSSLSHQAIRSLANSLHHWTIRPSGTEGYGKAEVTAGGVSTDELSSKTMESKRVPGLFFIGEVVDVTGHLGGFNFQWAWASGFSCGVSV